MMQVTVPTESTGPTVVTAYIGLGSNLDDPQAQVQRALRHLAAQPDLELTGVSRLYRSAPLGPADQPDYINAVAALRTALAPEALLDRLQAIEAAQLRRREGVRWGPRTLDLDILLYGDHCIDTPRLQVPHPGIVLRNFVLLPLADLAPALHIPGVGRVQDVAANCSVNGIEPLTTIEPFLINNNYD